MGRQTDRQRSSWNNNSRAPKDRVPTKSRPRRDESRVMATRAMSTRSGGGVLVSSDVCGHTQARAHTQAVCSSSRGVGTRQRKPLPLHPLCKHIPFTTGRRARDAKARGSGEGDKQGDRPVNEVLLPVLEEAELLKEAKWLGRTMARWLDDEWCEQQVHRDIGDSLCEAYVNPFDVANKAMEILMFKHDMGVCCQSEYEK